MVCLNYFCHSNDVPITSLELAVYLHTYSVTLVTYRIYHNVIVGTNLLERCTPYVCAWTVEDFCHCIFIHYKDKITKNYKES